MTIGQLISGVYRCLGRGDSILRTMTTSFMECDSSSHDLPQKYIVAFEQAKGVPCYRLASERDAGIKASICESTV